MEFIYYAYEYAIDANYLRCVSGSTGILSTSYLSAVETILINCSLMGPGDRLREMEVSIFLLNRQGWEVQMRVVTMSGVRRDACKNTRDATGNSSRVLAQGAYSAKLTSGGKCEELDLGARANAPWLNAIALIADMPVGAYPGPKLSTSLPIERLADGRYAAAVLESSCGGAAY